MGATHTSTVMAEVKAKAKGLADTIILIDELVAKGDVSTARRLGDALSPQVIGKDLSIGIMTLQGKLKSLQANAEAKKRKVDPGQTRLID